MSRYLGGFSPVAGSLIYQYVESNASATTTSGTFSAMSGTSITVLQTGTYCIDASVALSINASGTDNRAETQIFVGGTGNAFSLRQVGITLSGISLASAGWNMSSSSKVVVNLTAGDVVDFRFRRSGGSATVTALARTLMITKVG